MKFLGILLLSFCVASSLAYADESTVTTTTVAATPTTHTDGGSAFLSANKTRKGVVSLPDGLQYKILKAGKGDKPTANDTVTVDYEGKLIDGTVFDSSAKHGQPMTFPVQAVIPGWVEVLQLMPKGSTWEVYIPSDLAYGQNGAPPIIGPNETLIFKMTLLDIKK